MLTDNSPAAVGHSPAARAERELVTGASCSAIVPSPSSSALEPPAPPAQPPNTVDAMQNSAAAANAAEVLTVRESLPFRTPPLTLT